MGQTVYLLNSQRRDKRYRVVFTVDNRIYRVHFGSNLQNYLMHHDLNRKKSYLRRFAKQINIVRSMGKYGKLKSPMYWSWKLLWNKKTMAKSIGSIERELNINIINKIK